MYYGDLQQTYDDHLTMEDWKPFFDGVRNDWQGIVINVSPLSCNYKITSETVYQNTILGGSFTQRKYRIPRHS